VQLLHVAVLLMSFTYLSGRSRRAGPLTFVDARLAQYGLEPVRWTARAGSHGLLNPFTRAWPRAGPGIN
jgi:hypothetical protein